MGPKPTNRQFVRVCVRVRETTTVAHFSIVVAAKRFRFQTVQFVQVMQVRQ